MNAATGIDDRPDVSVRRAEPDDWAALRQVRLAALADAPWAFSSTHGHEAPLGEAEWRQRTQTAAWFLAWQDGDTVGVAAAFPQPDPAQDPDQSQAQVPDPDQAQAQDQDEEPDPDQAQDEEPGDTRIQPGPAAEWHVISMWASPGVRGSGVAGLLVAAIAGHVRAAGARRLTLWVADGNDRAHGFYRRAGFRPTGRRQTYQRPDGSGLDEDELALELR